MATYNGHKNYNHWNVSLWICNDTRFHYMACEFVQKNYTSDKKKAARAMLEYLRSTGEWKTPDGAPFSISSISAAMKDM